ncbi:hypothetical protein EDI_314090 [Entamoeba dispar SAW760]|uniref:Uncharacterized protein n=1 Tax=Entamoeba dispar (strain ATCC PRA-260 / SAW760) TaxID=370354 RepID=B0EH51_ENTDS|nr:uncharacterized protein EDI_314090 [Entamoeba dispar SAW760]EDR26148.1 hypothetical protein EDI_314090 [Entamoeba dispar SAW760]|eukprot:EDR26148.1 hypothetical protein EDI_314090 [Entamoeba dispar SAW760]
MHNQIFSPPTFQTPFSGFVEVATPTTNNLTSNNYLQRDYRIKRNTSPSEDSLQKVIEQLREQLKMKEEEIANLKKEVMNYSNILNTKDQHYKDLEGKLEFERKRIKTASENENQSKKELAKMNSVLKRYQEESREFRSIKEENTRLTNLLINRDEKIKLVESYNDQLKEEIQIKEEKVKQLEEIVNDRKMITEGTFDLN